MKKKTVRYLWLIALLVFPILLWLLPADLFDNSEILLCPSRRFFNIECLSCGLTRAVMHFHHFGFEKAIQFNGLVLIVYPCLVGLWVKWIYDVIK